MGGLKRGVGGVGARVGVLRLMQSIAFPTLAHSALCSPTHLPILPALIARSGQNWGRLAVSGGGSELEFRVGGRRAFALPLPEVSQAQQVRDEVMLEFPIDDTLAGECD